MDMLALYSLADEVLHLLHIDKVNRRRGMSRYQIMHRVQSKWRKEQISYDCSLQAIEDVLQIIVKDKYAELLSDKTYIITDNGIDFRKWEGYVKGHKEEIEIKEMHRMQRLQQSQMTRYTRWTAIAGLFGLVFLSINLYLDIVEKLGLFCSVGFLASIFLFLSGAVLATILYLLIINIKGLKRKE